jgi:hypothetical protein
MKPVPLVGCALALWCLTGCKGPGEPSSAEHDHGRYVGVGIYAPQAQWSKMTAAQQANAAPAARPIDDEAIIVVVDSTTGEVRECGDLSGYCVGYNPWRTPLSPGQTAPVSLTEQVQPPPSAASH